MALKLKLKVGGSSSPSSGGGSTPNKTPKNGNSGALPKIKIKPPKPDKVVKSESKEKLKKLTINFGPKKSQQLENLDIEGITQPVRRIPKVRVKPTRVPGDGYDSETPDMEDDPLIESGIVVRFMDDTNLSFVQNAVESNDFSGINIKWLTKEKALININGTIYAGRLVDVPTVTEVFKTVDKKNIFKVLDLCQILLVLNRVNPKDLNLEQDFEVPKDKLYKHPIYDTIPSNELKNAREVLKDGLIYPFEDVWRRFKARKLNHRILDDIESRVDDLIQLDNEAEESHFEFVDRNATNAVQGAAAYRASSSSPPPVTPGGTHIQTNLIEQDMDIDGSEDEASDFEEELAKVLETNAGVINDDMGEEEMVIGEVAPGDDDDDEGSVVDDDDDENEDDEDDDEEDDDEDDEDDNDEDDDHKADKQHVKMLEEEIADLEKAVESHRTGLANATHKMMKMKFQNSYNTLKASLDGKKRELSRLKEGENKTGETEKQDRQEDEDEDEEDEDEDEGDDDDEEEDEDDENNQAQDRKSNDEDEFDDIDDLF